LEGVDWKYVLHKLLVSRIRFPAPTVYSLRPARALSGVIAGAIFQIIKSTCAVGNHWRRYMAVDRLGTVSRGVYNRACCDRRVT
jgi:hypothetical protein